MAQTFKKSKDMNLKRLLLTLAVLFSFFTAPLYAQLSYGSGSFEFSGYKPLKDKPIKVFYYQPEGDVKNMPILFVMHGVLRNADTYRDNWIELAERYKILVIVPEFSKEFFPGSAMYNFGNVQAKNGSLNNESVWSFNLIDSIFDDVVKQTGSDQKKYDLFGHSAGSQFTHRFVLFMKKNKTNRVITANAGSYTALDFDVNYPYGIKNIGLDDERLKLLLQKELVVQLGEKDIDPNDKNLPKGKEAMKQGNFRLERGKYFYEMAKAQAKRLKVPFNWKLRTVPDAAHQNEKMAIDAAKYLYGN